MGIRLTTPESRSVTRWPRHLPYAAGGVVSVSLHDNGFARGVVARLDPGSASKICRSGNRGIIRGRWAIVGQVPGWDPERRPVPMLRRNGEVLVQYDDRTLKIVGELESHGSGCEGLPEDGLEGSGFVKSNSPG